MKLTITQVSPEQFNELIGKTPLAASCGALGSVEFIESAPDGEALTDAEVEVIMLGPDDPRYTPEWKAKMWEKFRAKLCARCGHSDDTHDPCCVRPCGCDEFVAPEITPGGQAGESYERRIMKLSGDSKHGNAVKIAAEADARIAELEARMAKETELVRKLSGDLSVADATIGDLKALMAEWKAAAAAENTKLLRQREQAEARAEAAECAAAVAKVLLEEDRTERERVVVKENVRLIAVEQKAERLKTALEMYPEWMDDDDPQAVGTMQRFVICLVCGGGGAFNGDGKPSKKIPPTHKPDCLRQAALRPAEEKEESNNEPANQSN